MPAIRLGLIGGNIAASQSPALHRAAGRLCGLDVSYDLIVPAAGQSFDAVFDTCVQDGYAGLNITYPFKEQVMSRVAISDAVQAAIGSCNTVVMSQAPHRGANTDYSGFIQAFRRLHGSSATPGHVAMAGAGGVGKAIAFALASLGADSIAVFDKEPAKADELKASVEKQFGALPVLAASSIEDAMEDADGLVNCTPLGMDRYGGSAFPVSLPDHHLWAFDAVYTPVNTPFVQAARQAGLAVLTGYELFLHQGTDAFRIFTGRDVDAEVLRGMLQAGEPERRQA